MKMQKKQIVLRECSVQKSLPNHFRNFYRIVMKEIYMKLFVFLFLLFSSCIRYSSEDLRRAQYDLEKAGEEYSLQKLEENQVHAKMEYFSARGDSSAAMREEELLAEEMNKTGSIRLKEAKARENLREIKKSCCTDDEKTEKKLFDAHMDSIFYPDRY